MEGMEYPIRMDDLGVPPILGNLRIISTECTAEMAYSASSEVPSRSQL